MPEPSRLVLLDQLPTIPTGIKVRFLGCVHAYHAAQAVLILRDHYPATEADISQANVAVEDILPDLGHDVLSVGAWLNVMGYVRAESNRNRSATSGPPPGLESSRSVVVAATMIWSAGAIRTDRYESAVREYQKPLRG